MGRFEGEKEFTDTKLENTTICPRCNIDLKTRGRFDTHIKKFHKDIYEGTPPVVDAPPPVHMRPGMHTPSYEGTPPVC